MGMTLLSLSSYSLSFFLARSLPTSVMLPPSKTPKMSMIKPTLGPLPALSFSPKHRDTYDVLDSNFMTSLSLSNFHYLQLIFFSSYASEEPR